MKPNEMNILRRSKIVTGKANDHSGEVILIGSPGFALDKTIFHSVDSKLTRLMLVDKLAVELFWSESAIARVTSVPMPLAPSHDDELIRFMRDEWCVVLVRALGGVYEACSSSRATAATA